MDNETEKPLLDKDGEDGRFTDALYTVQNKDRLNFRSFRIFRSSPENGKQIYAIDINRFFYNYQILS